MTTLIGALLLAGATYDTMRLLALSARRRPTLSRLAGHRAAAIAAERQLAHHLLTGRIDAAAYRRRMSDLAHPARHHRGVRHG